MTFTPNMIAAPIAVPFTPEDEWTGKVVPQGFLPTSVEDLSGGDIVLHGRIRYDYGPFQEAGNTGPAFAFLADRALVKALPQTAELAYTDRGAPLGTIEVGTETLDVYVYVERDVMCISTPGADENESRSYHRVVDLPLN
ncbi:hypothetical protein [Tsukamurella sp. 1534]|uniref:hypothetical protein n=1 Tax=Tsukamurella sp. 1534 TaxID=1151061 RepID=UPI0002EA8482|nr:hypothetical protein [Tsukamurella sp. 1534]